MSASGSPWWIVAIQRWSGKNRRWLSLIATSGTSGCDTRSSGIPAMSSRPCKVVMTGVSQCCANTKLCCSMWAWTMSNRSAAAQATSIVCCW